MFCRCFSQHTSQVATLSSLRMFFFPRWLVGQYHHSPHRLRAIEASKNWTKYPVRSAGECAATWLTQSVGQIPALLGSKCAPPQRSETRFQFSDQKKWSIANYIFHIPLQFFRFLRFVWDRLFIQIYPDITYNFTAKKKIPAFSTLEGSKESSQSGCSNWA